MTTLQSFLKKYPYLEWRSITTLTSILTYEKYVRRPPKELTPFWELQKNMILHSFFYSHFHYCPLIWMLSSKEANNKIEKLHKRALQIIHNNYDSTLDCHDLLQKDKSVTIYKKNLQFLMTDFQNSTWC